MKRRIPFERKVIGLLAIIILFVSISGVLVYGNLRSIIDEITDATRPDETLIVMKEMLYDVSVVENSVKSYSLTKNPFYLDQFDSKTTKVDENIQSLRELNEDDPDNLIYVDSLDLLTKNKFVVLEDILILQDLFKVEDVLDNVIRNIESAGGNDNDNETIENSEEKKQGFFKRLKEKRQKKKEEPTQTKEEIEESLVELEQKVSNIREQSIQDQNELKAQELELIQEDDLISISIRSIFTKLESLESKKIDAKVEEASQKSQTTKYLVAAFSLVVTILLVFAAWTIFSYVKRNNAYKKALKAAKDETELRNKEVLDSIHYAQRIQTAILPDLRKVEMCIPDSFILYKPKDIVAGDFYWMAKLDKKVLVAVADCTGHGVPGAMVSVVCSNALNRSVREFGLTEPAKILEKARELVIETLDEGDLKVSDGMDIALCAIDTATKMVQYAGAHNSLYLVKNETLHEIKADKQPVGRFSNARPFTNHVVRLETGDQMYLFTDGLADQFGGPKGKKFKYRPFKDLILSNATLSLSHQKDQLEKTFENWRGQNEQVDDICIIGIKL